MFLQVVTVYHRIEEVCGAEVRERWKRFVLEKVFFAVTTGERVTGKGSRYDAGGVLLIPFSEHAAGYCSPEEFAGEGWTIDEGDSILEGEIEYEVLRSASELRALGSVSTVTSIRRLLFGELAHLKIWCDGSQY